MIIFKKIIIINIKMYNNRCPKSFFFVGCSWGAAFHIGVYKGMVERWGYENINKAKICGNSSGAAIAIGIVLGYKWEELERLYIELSKNARELGVFGKMSNHHDIFLDIFFKDKNAYKKANNRLFIGITRFFNKHEVVSEWNSNEELINTLHASFHIPYYCTNINKVFNRRALDGGFSSTFKRQDEKTLVINPISKTRGEILSDIKLTYRDTVWDMNSYRYFEVRNHGYDKLMNWDHSYNIITDKRKNNILVFIFWSLRFLEEVQLKKLFLLIGIMLLFRKRLLLLNYIRRFIIFYSQNGFPMIYIFHQLVLN